MALELNGTTGVSLVQDGVVTAADLASTLDLTGKTVSLAAGGTGYGKVLQIVRGYLDTRPSFGANQNVWVDSGLTATITPSSTSSKILVHVSVAGWHSGGSVDSNFRLLVNGNYVNPPSSIPSGDSAALLGNWRGTSSVYEGSVRVTYPTLHSPNSTSAQTYKLQVTTEASSLVLNAGRQSGAGRFGATVSELILIEIAG